MTDQSNIDPLNRLETELTLMTPSALSAEVIDGIEQVLAARSVPWADRFLAAAMGMGVISVCVIVVVLLYGSGISPPTATPRIVDNSQILAGAEIAWVNQAK